MLIATVNVTPIDDAIVEGTETISLALKTGTGYTLGATTSASINLTDKVDHFRLLGDNKFGVEDLYGGGDRDYNDIVFQLTVKG